MPRVRGRASSRGRRAPALLLSLLAVTCAKPPLTVSAPAQTPVKTPAQNTGPVGTSGPPTASRSTAEGRLELPFYSTIALSEDGALGSDEIELLVSAPDGPFGELTRRGLAEIVRARRLRVKVPRAYPSPTELPLPYTRDCSHLIDCDDPSFSTTDLSALGKAPSPLALTDFTHHFITRKSLTRAFDIASRVLTRREGDCTEHAVLTTALARRCGYSARVILGLALLRQVGTPAALVGHAWSEIHDGIRWHLSDPAIPPEVLAAQRPSVAVFYLPISVVEREDAGFRLALLRTLDGSLIRSATAGPPTPVPARGPTTP